VTAAAAGRVRKLRTREVVPRAEYPNFRDHGKTVDRVLLRILGNLQRTHGEAWASEAGLRRMICEDEKHMPGVDTIPCALERLERQGLLEQHWLKPGGILPDGRVCTYGTRLVFLPQGRHARRGLVARANRRDGVTHRTGDRRRALQSLEHARAGIAKQLAPPPTVNSRELDVERKRREDLRRLAELEALWSLPPTGKPPPE
jgi:hypothetical protein